MSILERVKSLPHKIFEEKLLCSIAFNMHDSSVSFALNNRVILVLEAERVFRQKKKLCNHEEMEELIKYGLDILGKKVDDIKYWTMTTLNNPYLTRLDVIDFKNKEIKSPYWKKIEIFGSEKKVLIINHHLAHAGIYLSTNFKEALIISCDGGGDFNDSRRMGECLAVYTAKENTITKKDLSSFGDVVTGKIYGLCARFLYNAKYSEGKMMALAGYGETRIEYYNFLNKNFHNLERIDYRKGLKVLEQNFPNLNKKQTSKDAMDFAASSHEFFINKRLENIGNIIRKFSTGEKALILTGGAGLNLDLNTKILEKYPNLEHWIAPCCDDTGQSLGALFILIHEIFKKRPIVKYPYLGEGIENFEYATETLDKAVDLLLEDGILILHNGKSEIGPRALGNRSFIARPDSLEVKKKLSENIKQRESYRPVAPIVLEEKVHEYFIGPKKSPYMLYRYEVIKSQINKIIGAVHIDNSARAQTVNHNDNPFLYDLIKKFGDKTGTYVLLNTSLNLKGEPLTNKIEQSLDIYNKIEGPKMIIHDGKIKRESNT